MNDLRKAAEMALEAFELLDRRGGLGLDVHEYIRTKIEALRQALAEQEPVAWMCEDPHHIGQCVTIYKTPPSIEAAVLAEREACAKVCDDWSEAAGVHLAAAIRARGEK
jgi:hypothetical protein